MDCHFDSPPPLASAHAGRSTRRALCLGTFLLGALLLTSCKDRAENPPLGIGEELVFPSREMAELDAESRPRLALVASFGETVARGEERSLGSPVVERWERESLMEALLDEEIFRRSGLGEEILRARANEYPRHRIQLRQIFVPSTPADPDTLRAAAIERIREARARIQGGASFAAVADSLAPLLPLSSASPVSAPLGGLLPPMREGDWIPALWEAALALPVGQVSVPIETEGGIHLLQVVSRTILPFVEIRGEIVAEVTGSLSGEEREAARETLHRRFSEGITIPAGAIQAVNELLAVGGGTLAEWPGGTLRANRFRLWWGGRDRMHDPEFPESLAFARIPLGASAEELEESIRAAAVEERWVTEALAEGHLLAEGESAELRELWGGWANGWRETLGFEEGMGEAEIRRRAVEIVRSTEPEIREVVMELERFAPALTLSRPIRGLVVPP